MTRAESAAWAAVVPADLTRISLERGPCYGTCPIFQVTFQRDGAARYQGEGFVPRIGAYEGRIRQATFDRLATVILDSGFLALRGSYDEPITDAATVTTMIEAGTRRKVVSNYARSGPVQLELVERAIDAVARRVRWRALELDANAG